MNLLLLSAAVSLVAYTYSQILTDTGMIFNWAYNYADRKFPKWVAKPLIVCFKCVAGQMSFWYYIIKYRNIYAWDEHLFFTSFCIFFSLLLHKLYKWTTN